MVEYLATAATTAIQNLIHEEIKNRLAMLTTIHSSSLCLLCKRVKSKIYNIITLPEVLYGYEIWSVTLMEEHRREDI